MSKRELRIYQVNSRPVVQYGFWGRSRTGATARFSVLREWPAQDLVEAQRLRSELELDILLKPELQPPPDAQPQMARHTAARKLRECPTDSLSVVRVAVAGLPDPLPPTEVLSQRLGLQTPKAYRGGRHVDVYFAEPIYRRLLALALSAGVTRNRMLEALILAAEEMVP
jgi:hypothetical protein